LSSKEINEIEDLLLEKKTCNILLKSLFLSNNDIHIKLFKKISSIVINSENTMIKDLFDKKIKFLFKEISEFYDNLDDAILENNKTKKINLLQKRFSNYSNFIHEMKMDYN